MMKKLTLKCWMTVVDRLTDAGTANEAQAINYCGGDFRINGSEVSILE